MAISKNATIGWGDADVQAQEVTRQRALADQLLQRSETPLQGQMIGNRYVAPAWTQQLANGLSGYVGGELNKQADARTQDIAKTRSAALASALGQFGKDIGGTPAQTVPADENPWTSTPEQNIPAKPGDAGAAYAGLMKSGIPELQNMGMQGTMKNAETQAQLARTQAMGKILANAATPQAALAAGVPAEQVKTYFDTGLGHTKGVAVNGQLMDPIQGTPIGQAVPKQPEPFTLTPGSTRYGPDGKPIASVADPNKPFGPDGKPNSAYQQYAIGKARAGASNVSVNTANKPFLTEIGKGAGEQVMNDFAGARSAQATLNNANQIEQGLGNAIVGPGANARVKLAQVGQILGVNGKDATEQLQNTRNVMQGLARQELAAAGQMKGQGQITESERAILRKADSGDISELTVPEIQTFLGAIKKTANYRISIHNQNVDRLKKDPNAAGIVDYLNLPGDVAGPAQSPAPAGGGWSIKPVQ